MTTKIVMKIDVDYFWRKSLFLEKVLDVFWGKDLLEEEHLSRWDLL